MMLNSISNPGIIIFLAMLLVVVGLLMFWILLKKPENAKIDIQKYQKKSTNSILSKTNLKTQTFEEKIELKRKQHKEIPPKFVEIRTKFQNSLQTLEDDLLTYNEFLDSQKILNQLKDEIQQSINSQLIQEIQKNHLQISENINNFKEKLDETNIIQYQDLINKISDIKTNQSEYSNQLVEFENKINIFDEKNLINLLSKVEKIELKKMSEELPELKLKSKTKTIKEKEEKDLNYENSKKKKVAPPILNKIITPSQKSSRLNDAKAPKIKDSPLKEEKISVKTQEPLEPMPSEEKEIVKSQESITSEEKEIVKSQKSLPSEKKEIVKSKEISSLKENKIPKSIYIDEYEIIIKEFKTIEKNIEIGDKKFNLQLTMKNKTLDYFKKSNVKKIIKKFFLQPGREKHLLLATISADKYSLYYS